jgi:hypothetical protein
MAVEPGQVGGPGVRGDFDLTVGRSSGAPPPPALFMNGTGCQRRLDRQGVFGGVKNRDVFLVAPMDGFTAVPKTPCRSRLRVRRRYPFMNKAGLVLCQPAIDDEVGARASRAFV